MADSRSHLFSRVIARVSDQGLVVSSVVGFLALGLTWLLYPIFSGASEILFPGGDWWFLLELLVAAIPVAVAVLYLAAGSIVLIRSRSAKHLILMLLPIGLLVGIGYLSYPSDVARTHRRIDSFQLGAQIRVAWAGGSSRIRQDALSLLAATTETHPASHEWPDSLDALGAIAIEVDKDNQLVNVAIPRRRNFFVGDQFGYLIVNNGREPIIVDEPGGHGHRLWRIADGIYLYEKW